MSKREGQTFHVALVGNPNSGKSTLFNQLTGLRQKTGNFPGVTVDMKEGKLRFENGREAILTDYPGTYSLYPTASDEKMVAAVLTNPADSNFPNAVVYVADVKNLEKHLLLLTQLLDLNLPVILALNMADLAEEMGIKTNTTKLSEQLGIPVVLLSSRTGDNVHKLVVELEKMLAPNTVARKPFYQLSDIEKQVAEAVQLNLGTDNPYRALLIAHHHAWLPFMKAQDRETLSTIVGSKQFQSLRSQVDETLDRFDRFTPIVQDTIYQPPAFPETTTDRIDALLTNRWAGPAIFFLVMLLIFQAVFDWSEYPMGW
ncbi:MAG: ferrous iron transporter B, partial [Saprospiraceae bacterium]|nr:ferrous iron transporter B [Saprospiraceae bacterium]